MPTSEARILANQANAALSTGPKSAEGKARSRENAVKHGLTGEGIALPVEDLAEVDRRQRSFEAELKPSGDVARTLVRRMALMAVRMDRCVAHESASLTAHVHQALDDFDAEWPAVEGQEEPDRDKMRDLASRLALFDPSKEATLARKYEASAERGFFRALKEFRQVEKAAKATSASPDLGQAEDELGSFLREAAKYSAANPKAAGNAPKAVAAVSNARPEPSPSFPAAPMMPIGGMFEVPFTIGRAG